MVDEEKAVAERKRLEAVHRLEILDTAAEPEFDELVELAAAICGTPMCAISILDADRLWFKSSLGLNVTETPREIAFCHHTVQQLDLLLVEDATLDERFAENPVVKGEVGLRFYAGFPVASPEGEAVGTLCAFDCTPRTLSPEQRAALRVLAKQVSTRLELRAERRKLKQALIEANAMQGKLAASERRFQTFMDSGPFLSYLKDADGRMLYYNKRMAQHFDVSRHVLLNKTDEDLWPPELAHMYREHDLEVLRTGKLQVLEEATHNPDGSLSVLRSYKFPCTDVDGHMLVGGVSVDVTAERQQKADLERYQAELERANLRLSELASMDSLTGLANRRHFDERFATEFIHARRKGHNLSVLLLDIDDFKARNDTFGHLHGDDILRQLGAVLRRTIRAYDFAARYGGEEFVLLLPGSDESEAARMAARLLRIIHEEVWNHAPVTVSIGIAAMHVSIPNREHLLTLADQALYAAKRGGKDRSVCYSAYSRSPQPAAPERAAAPSVQAPGQESTLFPPRPERLSPALASHFQPLRP